MPCKAHLFVFKQFVIRTLLSNKKLMRILKDFEIPKASFKSLFYVTLLTIICHLSIAQNIPFHPNTIDSLGKKQGNWTIFYNAEWVKVQNPKLASYYRTINYKDNVPQGTARDFFITGELQWAGNLLSDDPEDVLTGEVNWYYRNGIVSRKEYYKNGKREGIANSYFDDGKLKTKETFKNNLLHGKYLSYQKKGFLYEKIQYRNGNKSGKSIRYYSNNKLSLVARYKNGEKHGIKTSYFQNGNIETTGDYENDELIGTHSFYYKNGQLQKNVFYIKGEKNGIVKEYYESGDLKLISQYSQDQLIGTRKEYYESGQLKSEIAYKNGQWDGPYISYHENGKVNTIGYYTQFKKNGEFSSFLDNGKLRERAGYKNGKKDGEELSYDKSGFMRSRVFYENGNKLSVKKYDAQGNLTSERTFKNRNSAKSATISFGNGEQSQLNDLAKKLNSAIETGDFADQKNLLTEMIGIVSDDLADSLSTMPQKDRKAYLKKFGELNIRDHLLSSISDLSGLSESEKESKINSFRLLINNFIEYAIQQSVSNPESVVELLEFRLLTKGIIFESFKMIKEQIFSNGDSSLISKYNKWQQNNLEISESDTADSSLNESEINHVRNENKTLAKELSNQSMQFGHSINTEEISWTQIIEVLQPTEAFVEVVRLNNYQSEENISYHFIILKAGQKIPEIISIKNGNQLEGAYLKAYLNRIKFKLTDTTSYNRYWKPISASLANIKKVYWSPDGVYHQLNPESFKNPETGNYLIDELALESISTGSRLLVFKNDSSAYNKPLKNYNIQLFGYPEYNLKSNSSENALDSILGNNRSFLDAQSEIVMLPGTKEEVQAIKSICNSISLRPSIYLKKAASELSLKNAKNPDILHIATHGFFLENENELKLASYFDGGRQTLMNNPMLRSALLFSGARQGFNQIKTDGENGILTAQEVIQLSLEGTKLVVLSACETGLGEINYGEGVYGLQRAFQYAGAETILMSLWSIDDQASKDLMVYFYENLLIKKQSANQALSQAKTALRKKYPEPYFWAAFKTIR